MTNSGVGAGCTYESVDDEDCSKSLVETLKELHSSATLFLVLTIITGIVWCCCSMCLYCFWSSIKLAINVVDASADFVMATKRILIIPFVYFIVSVIVVIGWFIGYMMVMSINEIKP